MLQINKLEALDRYLRGKHLADTKNLRDQFVALQAQHEALKVSNQALSRVCRAQQQDIEALEHRLAKRSPDGLEASCLQANETTGGYGTSDSRTVYEESSADEEEAPGAG